MKILLVAGFFPPYAPISATRVNKLAKFLHQNGHDVRVLAARNIHYPPVMSVEIPEEKVTFAPVFEVTDAPAIILGACKRLIFGKGGKGGEETSGAAPPTPAAKEKKPSRPGLLARIRKGVMTWYRSVVSLPDARIGWYPYAIREGHKILADWRPDLIYASAPPHTSLLVASRLARNFDIPWFCEYRDLWCDHPYYDGSWLRRFIETRMERRLLGECKGLVTVTGTWAEHLKQQHGKPVAFIMNGFDPDDYAPPGSLPPLDEEHLTILYAGGIYPGKRDPSALFCAMGEMGEAAKKIRVHFFMPADNVPAVREMAVANGVLDQVILHDLVQRDEVINLQQRSDILLLLRWDNPEENGVLAGKLFEYIGSGRPILSLGSVTGEAADIIRQRGLGLVSNDSREVVNQLKEWLELKAQGGVPAPEASDLEIFSRNHQFTELMSFLESCIEASKG